MVGPVRTRFAPSPTGDLHVGGARTALFNWLFTRRCGGEFILRIEDTDFGRSARKYIDRIISAMDWLGLDRDEGPHQGGPHEPYHQSKRLEKYQKVLEELRDQGLIYRCYCTKKELERQRKRQLDRGESPRYNGRCRNLDPGQKAKYEDEDRDYTYRYRIPRKPVTVNDIVKGEVSFPPDQVGDFIILKSNGSPSYNFAVVVDDHFMDISHVIRGDDHLSNTPRQLYLYDALGWEPPNWCHLAMILGKDGERLSKRHGATDVETYQQKGYLPEAMNNALALLGWSPPDGIEYRSISQLVESFELSRVSKSPSRFDLDKFTYLNGKHLRDLDVDEIIDRLKPEFLPSTLSSEDESQLDEILEVVRDQLTLLSDFKDLYNQFFHEPIEPTDEALSWLKNQDRATEYLKIFREAVSEAESLNEESVKSLIGQVRSETGASGRSFFLPLRIGITGRMEGPEFHEIMAVIGSERSVKRIDTILNRVEEFIHVRD